MLMTLHVRLAGPDASISVVHQMPLQARPAHPDTAAHVCLICIYIDPGPEMLEFMSP